MSRTFKPYRSYKFTERDPVIDKIRGIVSNSEQNYKNISEASGVSAATMSNWFRGKTKRPQFCTIAAVAAALGQSITFAPKGSWRKDK